MVTGGFTSVENTETTEILESRSSSWKPAKPLPYARNGLRAANVANTIYLFVGTETEILKYEANSSSWVHYANMTAKEGSKLEVSVINCNVIQNYLTNSSTTTPIYPTTRRTLSEGSSLSSGSTEPPPTASPSTGCQAGWSSFNGQCYKYFSEEKTWYDAEVQCVKEEVRHDKQ